MRDWKLLFKIFVLICFFFSGKLFAVAGWNKAKLVAEDVGYYYPDSREGHWFVFEKETKEKSEIILYAKDGKKHKVLSLPRGKVPLTPTIAINSKYVFIAWQQSNNNIIQIKYVSASRKNLKFSSPQILLEGGLLPVLITDLSDNIYFIAQKETATGVFAFQIAVNNKNKFSTPKQIVKNSKFLSRGIFFPAIISSKNYFDIIYQSRQKNTYTDELFLLRSTGGLDSFSLPRQLTFNIGQDYSPDAIFYKGKLNFVWQSKKLGIWGIFLAIGNNTPVKISAKGSNAYQATITNSKRGRIVAWYDFRKKQPGIYARFIDQKEFPKIFKDHRVTPLNVSCQKPKFSGYLKPILYYRCNKKLYQTFPDAIAKKMKVKVRYSKNANQATFSWTSPNDPSGIESYAWLISKKPVDIPTLYNLRGSDSEVVLKGLDEGSRYFHIRYKDFAGNESDPVHIPFSLDISAPTKPEVFSDTHPERVMSEKTDAEFIVRSQDDSGIKRYFYGITQGVSSKLNQISENGKIKIKNLLPGKYFLVVRAEDHTGKFSKIAKFSFGVAHHDSKELIVTSNIVDGRLNAKHLDFFAKVHVDKKIIKANIVLAQDKKNPWKGKELKASEGKDGFEFRIDQLPVKSRVVVSIGFIYADGSRSSVRHFKYYRVLSEEELLAFLGDEIKVSIKKQSDIFEVSFSTPIRYQELTWSIDQEPGEPSDERYSYNGGFQYIYLIDPGFYYVNIAARLKTRVLYRSVKIEIDDERNFLGLVLASFSFLILVLSYLFRRRIFYKISLLSNRLSF